MDITVHSYTVGRLHVHCAVDCPCIPASHTCTNNLPSTSINHAHPATNPPPVNPPAHPSRTPLLHWRNNHLPSVPKPDAHPSHQRAPPNQATRPPPQWTARWSGHRMHVCRGSLAPGIWRLGTSGVGWCVRGARVGVRSGEMAAGVAS
jgi:hypothetical protein